MARLIVKWRYIKPGAPKQSEHYVNYIATREGVEIEGEKWKDEPATKEQEKLVNRLIAGLRDGKDEVHRDGIYGQGDRRKRGSDRQERKLYRVYSDASAR